MMKEKIVNIVICLMIIFMLGAAGLICHSIYELDKQDKDKFEQINRCHKLLRTITDEYRFDRLDTSDFDAVRKCFTDNRDSCEDFKQDNLSFTKKILIIDDFKDQFQSLKKSSNIEQELFLAKINRVMLVSTTPCYNKTCKTIGEPFICPN